MSFCQYLLSKYNLQIQTTINWAFARMLNSTNWYILLSFQNFVRNHLNVWLTFGEYFKIWRKQLSAIGKCPDTTPSKMCCIGMWWPVLKNDNIAQLFYFIILQCAQLLWNQHYPQTTSSMATSPNLLPCFLPIVFF